MKVIQTDIVDDCYESMYVRDIHLDNDITKELILYLAEFGKLIFEERLERPYFKVICKGRFTLKGVLSNRLIRIVFPDDELEDDLEVVTNKVNAFET